MKTCEKEQVLKRLFLIKKKFDMQFVENGSRKADGGLQGEEETIAHFTLHLLIAILLDIAVDQPSMKNLIIILRFNVS